MVPLGCAWLHLVMLLWCNIVAWAHPRLGNQAKQHKQPTSTIILQQPHNHSKHLPHVRLHQKLDLLLEGLRWVSLGVVLCSCSLPVLGRRMCLTHLQRLLYCRHCPTAKTNIVDRIEHRLLHKKSWHEWEHTVVADTPQSLIAPTVPKCHSCVHNLLNEDLTPTCLPSCT